jgi:hypothetical protein
MKKAVLAVFVVLVAVSMSFGQTCNTIKSGAVVDSKGNPITTGFDQYGYNYQAHLFNGLTANYSRPDVVATEGDESLVMKWSGDWLANVSCSQDGTLSRGYDAKTGNVAGFSKGWVTNHFEGDYLGSDGEMHHYTYFAKIVYDNGTACKEGKDTCLWGLYTIIEEINNDPFGEYLGNTHKKLTHPAGLGHY